MAKVYYLAFQLPTVVPVPALYEELNGTALSSSPNCLIKPYSYTARVS